MSLATLTQFLMWCTILNYVLLLVWCLILKLPHTWIYQLSSSFLNLKLTEEQFDAYNFLGIVLFKCAIVLFNLVPFIALHFVG